MRQKGTVIEWHYEHDRGWGYILGEDGIKYDAHWSEIKMPGHYTLEEGMKVSFESNQSEGDILAINVQVEE